MARPVRIEYPGAVYPVITRGNNRQAIFKVDKDRTTYLEKLSHYCQAKEVHLLCYCLLSNHVARKAKPYLVERQRWQRSVKGRRWVECVVWRQWG